LQQRERWNGYNRFLPTVPHVKVGRRMTVVVHRNDDAEKPADFGHLSSKTENYVLE
jgi:hypothetical protein